MAKTYQINSKLISFLDKEKGSDQLSAKILPAEGTTVLLKLSEGVIIQVSEKELGIKMGKATSGIALFDNKGNLTKVTLNKPATPEVTTQKGASHHRVSPEFN